MDADLCSLKDRAAQIDQGADEPVIRGQVERDNSERVWIDVDEGGRLADVRPGSQAEFLDDSVCDEFVDEVGYRDAGQYGCPRDVGPTHRPRVQQRLEHERAVVLPIVFRQGLWVTRRARLAAPGPSDRATASMVDVLSVD